MRDVSTPPFLDRPEGVQRWEIPTPRGPVVAWVATPGASRPERPHPVATADVDSAGTALLVPGFTGSKEDFIAVLRPLAAAGWTVVAIDQRGQHETPGPDDEAAYALAELGADVVDVTRHLIADPATSPAAGAVHLLGHSLGGLVARTAVLAAPQLFASLTLLCSGPGALPLQAQGSLQALRAAVPAVPLETVWAVKEAQDRAAGWQPPSEPIAAFMRARFLVCNPYGMRAMAGHLLAAEDEVDALAAVWAGRPVLVAYGAHDDAWPLVEQDQMAARLGCDPVVLPGCGHSPAADAPDLTVTLLNEFWNVAAAAVRPQTRPRKVC